MRTTPAAHPGVAALIRQLHNNPASRAVCDFDGKIPSQQIFGAVRQRLGENPDLLAELFVDLTNRVKDARPDFGRVVRHSANVVRAVRRNDFDEARPLAGAAGDLLSETRSIRAGNPEIYYAGFLADARKEYADANIGLAIIAGADIPDAGALDIDSPAYLNGMAGVIANSGATSWTPCAGMTPPAARNCWP